MPEPKCVICGTGTTGPLHCSERCKWKARPRHACVECGLPTGWVLTDSRAPAEPRHRACRLQPCGTVAAYKRGCRCAECRAANTTEGVAYQRARREEIGRAHVRTPVTNAHLGCRLLLAQKTKKTSTNTV